MPRAGKAIEAHAVEIETAPNEWLLRQEVAKIPLGYIPRSIIPLSDGLLAVSTTDTTIDLWDPKRQKKEDEVILSAPIAALAKAQDEMLVAGLTTGVCVMLDPRRNEIVQTSKAAQAEIKNIGMLANGVVLHLDADAAVRAWMPKSNKEGKLPIGNGAKSLLFTPGQVIFGFAGGETLAYDPRLSDDRKTTRGILNSRHTKDQAKEYVIAAGALPVSGELVLGDSYGVVHIVKAHDLKSPPRAQFKVQDFGVDHLLISPDAKVLTAGKIEPGITVWDIWTRKSLTTLQGHQGGIAALTQTADGSIISGGKDGTLRVWTLPQAAT